MTFGAGERILSDWMNQNVFIYCVEHPAPWEIEGPSASLADQKRAMARPRSLDVVSNGSKL